jgi:hypothetical protein
MTSTPLTQDRAQAGIRKINEWVEKNETWLTAWLTNVVMVAPGHANKQFQVFQRMVEVQPPQGLLLTGMIVKRDIIMASVFGKPKSKLILNPHELQASGYLNGFLNQFKRMPTEKDIALFTATEWMSVIIRGSNWFLRSTVSVEFFPGEGA